MTQKPTFHKVDHIEELTDIKTEWLSSLSSPQDGMWDVFRNNGEHWAIKNKDEIIGYASIGEGKQLLQFYISPKHEIHGKVIFKAFIDAKKTKSGLVGTNNLTYLSMALHYVKEVHIDTYLFRSHSDVLIEEKEGILHEGQGGDLEQIVEFCQYSMGAPKEWLLGYIGELIKKKEIFYLADGDKIIGTCEVRKSTSAPDYADIGMVISPDYRRRGYGTYMLHRAKTIAKEWGKTPICSCEKDNVGSWKSITKCGFISRYQLLSISFT